MKSKFWISFIFSLLLTLLSWFGNNLMPRVVAEQNQQCEAIARVDKIRGEASRIPLHGESDPLAVNQRLCRGDLIEIAAEAQVTVTCNANKQSESFPISSAIKKWGVANICPPLSICDRKDCNLGPEDSFDIIIYPSNTALTINNPKFSWSSVPDATHYTLTLKDFGEEEIWEKTVDTNEMDYPSENGIFLEFGEDYILTVEAFRDDKSLVVAKKTVLTLLDEDEIKADAEQLRPKDSETIPSLVRFYRNEGLNARAIAYLEGLDEQGNQSSAIYFYLGDLYWQVERREDAVKAYLKSLQLAEANHQNQLSKALIYARLGQAYQKMGKTEEAGKRLNQAIKYYQEAGDGENAEKVGEFLSG